MGLFKYLSFEGLKRTLAGSVRFTQPGAFNDPFEMLPVFDMEDLAHKPGKSAISVQFDLTGPRRSIDEMNCDGDKSTYEHDYASRLILAHLNKTVGVFCMSRNPASLLMWAHYADEHSGGLIEFNQNHPFFSGTIDVHYRRHRPSRSISTYLNASEPVPIAELCVKSQEWQYEEETRLIRALAECDLQTAHDKHGFAIHTTPLPSAAIKAVVVGDRMPKARQRELFEMVKGTPVHYKIASIDVSEYKLFVEPVKLDWPLHQIISPRSAHLFLGGS